MDTRGIELLFQEQEVQIVGTGWIDCICPLQNLKSVLTGLEEMHTCVTHYTLWEDLEKDAKSKVGLGGPMKNYAEGWYSEVVSYYEEFKSYEDILSKIEDLSKEYQSKFAPGLWLSIKDE